MSATYNWAYNPTSTNKYGFSITSSADNIQPSNACYVALFGNDTTGNGSRQLPFKTVAKGIASAPGGVYYIIIAAGVYRENIDSIPANTGGVLVGDGDVIIDVFLQPFSISNPGKAYNIQFRNVMNLNAFDYSGNIRSTYDCSMSGDGNGKYVFLNDKINTLITNFAGLQIDDGGTVSASRGFNTFVNIANFITDCSIVSQGCLWFSIFYNCNFDVSSADFQCDYSLFFNCSARIGSSGAYTPFTDRTSLLAIINGLYPSNISFQHCLFVDPQFNNASIGDYSIGFSSPAKNASYFGTYIGAFSISYALKSRAIEANGAFDFSTNTNLTIADDSITLTNTALLGSIETKVIANIIGREIAKLPTYGFNADRNGQYIDSIGDLSGTLISSGTPLTINTPYLVLTAAISYNGNIHQPGERFTTNGSITAFTTASGGQAMEITEAPQRHTVMGRFTDGDGTVTAGSPLVVGYWYFVVGANIVYDTVTYVPGALFKAVDTNSFTGTGTLTIAMSTETYQHYEIGNKPYSNNTGNVPSGSIIRGNGDPSYVRGGIGVTEFVINAKFIQLKYIIQVANLTP